MDHAPNDELSVLRMREDFKGLIPLDIFLTTQASSPLFPCAFSVYPDLVRVCREYRKIGEIHLR